MTAAVLVEITRRDVLSGAQVVESRHHGHVVVVGPGGAVVGSLGDPDRPTFVRSAAKPFQATASLELAGDAAADVTDAEVAVGWASHRAEPVHLEAVSDLLARSGTDPDDLTTPPAVPKADPAAEPSRIGHNCSGKHALFALAGRARSVPRAALLDPAGPLQRRVLSVLTEAFGEPGAVAVDGCGAPAVQVPLRRLAEGFRRLEVEDRWARVRDAGLAHPGLVGGEGRLETALLGAGVLAKPGAEGVFAAAWTAAGEAWGVAVKAEDGASRASAAVLHGLLRLAGIVPRDLWFPEPVLGGGSPQGEVRPARGVQELAERLRG